MHKNTLWLNDSNPCVKAHRVRTKTPAETKNVILCIRYLIFSLSCSHTPVLISSSRSIIKVAPLSDLLLHPPGHLREGHLSQPEELRAAAGRNRHLPVQGGRLPHAGLPGLPVRVSERRARQSRTSSRTSGSAAGGRAGRQGWWSRGKPSESRGLQTLDVSLSSSSSSSSLSITDTQSKCSSLCFWFTLTWFVSKKRTEKLKKKKKQA